MVRETRHLWVGNIPETVREDRIREHFKRYGRVQSVKIITSATFNTAPSSSSTSLSGQKDQQIGGGNGNVGGGGIGGGGVVGGGHDDIIGSTLLERTGNCCSIQGSGGGGSGSGGTDKTNCIDGNSNANNSNNSNINCNQGNTGNRCDSNQLSNIGQINNNSNLNNNNVNNISSPKSDCSNSNQSSATSGSNCVGGNAAASNGGLLSTITNASTATTTSLSSASALSSSSSSASLSSSATASSVNNNFQTSTTINKTNYNNNCKLQLPSNGCICATIAFMDIKSASKAHIAEHKIDDRVLTTEYYEPSSINNLASSFLSSSTSCTVSSAAINSSSSSLLKNDCNAIGGPLSSSSSSASSNNNINCSSSNAGSKLGTNLSNNNTSLSSSSSSASSLISPPPVSLTNNISSLSMQQQQQYSHLTSSSSSASALSGRFSSNHGTPEDNSPGGGGYDSSRNFYERNSNRVISDTEQQYIRRPSNYHNTDGRGRPRERHYRNGPYISSSNVVVDRSNPINHHRLNSSTWYETSSSSSSTSSQSNSRNIYGNIPSAVVQPELISSASGTTLGGQTTTTALNNYDLDTSINHKNISLIKTKKKITTNNNISASNNSSNNINNINNLSNKSRSGSESPSGGDIGGSRSSRSLSRSPSSCSSTNSTTSNDSSSPISESDHSRLGGGGGGGSSLHHHHHHNHHPHHHNSSTSNSNSNNNHHTSSSSNSSNHHNHHNHHSSKSLQSAVGSISINPSSSSSVSSAAALQGVGAVTSSSAAAAAAASSSSSGLGSSASSSTFAAATVAGSGSLGLSINSIACNSGSLIGGCSSGGGGSGDSSSSVGGNDDNRPLIICVRNLPARSSDTSLKDGLFHEYKKHGKVTWVKVVGQNTDRYALVCFKKPEDVEKALEVSHDKLFFGCKIEVAPYQGYDVEDNEFRPYEAELDEYHPKSTRTLFIGNLEKDISPSELRKHFDCFGEIIEIDIKKQGVTAYAFCQYSDIVSVVKAMRKMDGEHLGNNRIKLGFGKSMPSNCVWIDGISEIVSENYLSSHFNRFGSVQQVAIDRERKLALVLFEQVHYAQTAVKEMRGVTLRGRKLQVDFASRECQEAFYEKIEKQQLALGGGTGAAGTVIPFEPLISGGGSGTTGDRVRELSSSRTIVGSTNSTSFDANSTTGGSGVQAVGSISSAVSSVAGSGSGSGANSTSRSYRYDSAGRGRASSFSRPPNPISGATSPTSSTPRSSSGRSRIVRYTSTTDYYDSHGNVISSSSTGGGGSSNNLNNSTNSDYIDSRKFRSYDEFSQGSGASFDDDVYDENLSYNSSTFSSRDRVDSPPPTTPLQQKQLSSSISSRLGNVTSLDADSSMSTSTPTTPVILQRPCDKSPGDIRNLQKERVHLLEQLEECPSSGDEIVSPKKRIRYNIEHNVIQQQTQLTSDHHLNQSSSNTKDNSDLIQTTHHHSSGTSGSGSSSNTNNSNLHNHLHHHQHPHLHNNSNLNNSENNNSNSSLNLIQQQQNSNHRKSVEIRRLSECSLNQNKLSSASASSSNAAAAQSTLLLSSSSIASTPSSSLSGGNTNIVNINNSNCNITRRPSTDNSLMLRNITGLPQLISPVTTATSATPLAATPLAATPSTEHSSHNSYSHSLNKRRKTGGGGSSSSSSSSNLFAGISNSISSDTNSIEHHHSSRGRGHQLHSIHSHEASGGESADGSRPGTPLCDERPENILLPCEPRRIPRARSINAEPWILPLPKFAIQFFQNRSFSSFNSLLSSSSSATMILSSTTTTTASGTGTASNTLSTGHSSSATSIFSSSSVSSSSLSSLSTNSSIPHMPSSLLNSLSSPPPALQTTLSKLPAQSSGGNSGSSNSHATSLTEQAPASPSRAASINSNSSDSDVMGDCEADGPSTSPSSLYEHLRSFSERYEKWSDNSSGRHHMNNNMSRMNHHHHQHHHHHHHQQQSNHGHHNNSDSFKSSSTSAVSSSAAINPLNQYRQFLDLDVNEVQPSDIAKTVLAKKSIFDDDSKRLENIDDKYEPRDLQNYTKNLLGLTVVTHAVASSAAIPSAPASAPILPTNHSVSTPTIPTTPVSAPVLQSSKTPILLQNASVQQRLITNSPINSVQTAAISATPVITPVGVTQIVAAGAASTNSSPYNSPTPTAATSSIPSVKGLQYPFPSHPPTTANTIPTTTASFVTSSSTSTTTSLSTTTTTTPSVPPLSKSSGSNDLSSTTSSSGTTATKSIIPNKIKSSFLSNKSVSLSEISNKLNHHSQNESNNNSSINNSNNNSSSSSNNNNHHNNGNRTLIKSTSVPGSTNTGTVIQQHSSTNSINSSSINETTNVSKSSTSEQHLPDKSSNKSSTNTSSTSASSNVSKKYDSVHKTKSLDSSSSGTGVSGSDKKSSSSSHHKDRRKMISDANDDEYVSNSGRSERGESITKDSNEKEKEYEREKSRGDRDRKDKDKRKEQREKDDTDRDMYEEKDRKDKDDHDKREKMDIDKRVRDDDRERFDKEDRERKPNMIKDRDKQQHAKDVSNTSSKDIDDKLETIKTENLSANENETSCGVIGTSSISGGGDHATAASNKSERSHPADKEFNTKRKDRHSSSSNSPVRITSKRRLSSQDSNDSPTEESLKKIKSLNEQHRKISDRRDSKDPNHSNVNKHHKSISSSSSHSKNNLSKEVSECKDKIKMKSSDDRSSSSQLIGKEPSDHDKYKFSSDDQQPSRFGSSKGDSSFYDDKKKEKYQMDRDKHQKKKNRENRESRDSRESRGSRDSRESPKDKESSIEKNYHDHRSTSEDDECHRAYKKEMRERNDFRKKHNMDDSASEYRNKMADYENSKKRSDKHGDRKSVSKMDTISSDELRRKIKSSSQTRKLNSSDDTDSDGGKKHSIFEIPDDVGPYISMYDKVKARSCKNMQKQEEEKKIKAKFTQLKQSRAKREEKKRNSWDDESDSDMHSDSSKYHKGSGTNKSMMATSSDDDGNSSTIRRKESLVSDSDDEVQRAQYNRERLNDLCDDDSSESTNNPGSMHMLSHQKVRRKLSSRKNSRSARIASSESSADEDEEAKVQRRMRKEQQKHPNRSDKHITNNNNNNISNNNNNHKLEGVKIKEENKSKVQENIKMRQIKFEPHKVPQASDISDDDILKTIKTEQISDTEIKKEPIDNSYKHSSDRLRGLCDVSSEGEQPHHKSSSHQPNQHIVAANMTQDNLACMKNKSSSYDQLFSPESRKKHKNKKKRHKNTMSMDDNICPPDDDKMEDIKNENISSNVMPAEPISSTVTHFDAIKRHDDEKKKHGSKKDKRRDKVKDDYERIKDDRSKMKKSKKFYSKDSSKLSSESSMTKREEKMEDIFGPLSDEDSHCSGTEHDIRNHGKQQSRHSQQTAPFEQVISSGSAPNVRENKETHDSEIVPKYKDEKQEQQTPQQSQQPPHHQQQFEKDKQKEESKKRKEKKRKEREKQRASLNTNDENSVDLDEAGRALEAQLMSDSEGKTEQITPISASTNPPKSADMLDVFRFTDGDDSMETSFTEKRENSDNYRKEKKKKKKRTKEEKHKHSSSTHHSSSAPSIAGDVDNANASNANNNASQSSNITPSGSSSISAVPSRLTLDMNHEKDEPLKNICKQSPSLPCLLDDSSPISTQPSTQTPAPATSDLSITIPPTSKDLNPSSPSVKSGAVNILSPTAVSEVSKHRKNEKYIPGFRAEIDEKIHESAVMSISTEYKKSLIGEKIEIDKGQESIDNKLAGSVKLDEKPEEKSRVIISQEETEDAVAALLGESFGTSNTPDFTDFDDDPVIPEESIQPIDTDVSAILPDEDAEEMNKAIQSLNAEELDLKPDTPQSEHDLQIDTDTEDLGDEETNSSAPMNFDNPPKTPDVDLSSIVNKANDKPPVGDSEKADKTNVVAPTVALPSVITKTSSEKVIETAEKPYYASVVKTPSAIVEPTSKIVAPSTAAVSVITTESESVHKSSSSISTVPPSALESTPSSKATLPNHVIGAQKSTTPISPTVSAKHPIAPTVAEQSAMQAPSIKIPDSNISHPVDSLSISPRDSQAPIIPLHIRKKQLELQQQQQQQLQNNMRISHSVSSPTIMKSQSGNNSQLSPGIMRHNLLPPSMQQFVPGQQQHSQNNRNNSSLSGMQSGNQKPLTQSQPPPPPQQQHHHYSVQRPSHSMDNVKSQQQQQHQHYHQLPGKSLHHPQVSNIHHSQNILTQQQSPKSISQSRSGVPPNSMASSTVSAQSMGTSATTTTTANTSRPVTTPSNQIPHLPTQPQPPQHVSKSGDADQKTAKTVIESVPAAVAPKTPYVQVSREQIVYQHKIHQQPQQKVILHQQPLPTSSIITTNIVPASTVAKSQIQTTSIIQSTSNVIKDVGNVVKHTSANKTPIVQPTPTIAAAPVVEHKPTEKALDTVNKPADTAAKAETNASETKSPTSLLTEENVSKITSNAQDDHTDSKEDSDYWSAKEINIESVIKKVDALLSEEDTSEAGSEVNKDDWTDESKKSTQTVEKSEVTAAEHNKTESEVTNDEDDFDEGVVDNIESKDAGFASGRGRRGRLPRGGRKSSNEGITAKTPEESQSIQTRRGVKTPGKRGRGGRPSTRSAGSTGQQQSQSGQSQQEGAGKPRNQNSESDVYEFHDDSGEDNALAVTNTNAAKSLDGVRPRLILTIKSQSGATTTTTVTTTTSVQATASIPTTMLSTPITLPTTTASVVVSSPLTPKAASPGSPASSVGQEPVASPQQQDDFVSPAANTRKSRRLQERDGSRSTIDDVIEDVIRYVAPGSGIARVVQTSVGQSAVATTTTATVTSSVPANIVMSQSTAVSTAAITTTSSSTTISTTPRRSTRQNANIGVSVPNAKQQSGNASDKQQTSVPSPSTDIRKSPRANRRAKDRKISENSTDSSDEKNVKIDKLMDMPSLTTSALDVPISASTPSVVVTTSVPAISSTVSTITSVPSASVIEDNRVKDKAPDAKEQVAQQQPVKELPLSVAQPGKPTDPKEQQQTLIDPVTGMLTVVRQCKEGQYVSIPKSVTSTSAATITTATTLLSKTTSVVTTAGPVLSTTHAKVLKPHEVSLVTSQAPPVQVIPQTVNVPQVSTAGVINVKPLQTIVVQNPPQQPQTPANLTANLLSKSTISDVIKINQQTQPQQIAISTIIQTPPQSGSAQVIQQVPQHQQHIHQTHPQLTQPPTSNPKPLTLKSHVLNSQMALKAAATIPPPTIVINQNVLQQSHQQQISPKNLGTPVQPTHIIIQNAASPHMQQQQQQLPKSVPITTIVTPPVKQSQLLHGAQTSQHGPRLSVNIPPDTMSPQMINSPDHKFSTILLNKNNPHPTIQLPKQTSVHHMGSISHGRSQQQMNTIMHGQSPSHGSIIHVQAGQQHSPQQPMHKQHPQQSIIIHEVGKMPTQQQPPSQQPPQSQQQQQPQQMQPSNAYTSVLQPTKIIQQTSTFPKHIQGQPLQLSNAPPIGMSPHYQASPTKHPQAQTQQQQITIQHQQQQQPHPIPHPQQIVVNSPNIKTPYRPKNVSNDPNMVPQPQHIQHIHNNSKNPQPLVLTHQQQQHIINTSSVLPPGVHKAIGQQQHPHPHMQQTIQVQQQQQQQQQTQHHHVIHQQPTVLTKGGHPLPQHLQQHSQHAVGQGVPPIPLQSKTVIGLHQSPQILTGAVASPPLKQPHLSSQQPVVTGASSSRVSIPPISPQGQSRGHLPQTGLTIPAYEHGDVSGYGTYSQSPPPAHQQSSPITPADPVNYRNPGVMLQHIVRTQHHDAQGIGARIPHISRSPMLPGELKELAEMDDVTSPPLELRRPASGPRTIPVPHNLQSPGDRATDSPQVQQVYMHNRIPHPHYTESRYFDNVRSIGNIEPPPAHRSHNVVTPTPIPPYATQPTPPPPPSTLAHIREREQREREQREKERERISIPGHTSGPNHASSVSAMPVQTGRNLQVATPPHGCQVPPQPDSLLMLLQRYPVMWQGLLALKNDQAAVQMHFVFGNPTVAVDSLPCNSDGSTPPLRIAQRMRLEPAQIDGVSRKMQMDKEHCMLLALPCGRDHRDVLQQSNNLQTGFITYLQQKQAAGIINIAGPGSQQAAYVVHIFPSCDFANENLARTAPDLLHRVADIAHLLIVIATV